MRIGSWDVEALVRPVRWQCTDTRPRWRGGPAVAITADRLCPPDTPTSS